LKLFLSIFNKRAKDFPDEQLDHKREKRLRKHLNHDPE